MSSPNAMTLGRPLFDMADFGPDVPESVRQAFENLRQAMVGAGWMSGARAGDTTYQNVVARLEDAIWTLYAGRPDTPTNPDVIVLAGGGGGGGDTVIVSEEGTPLGSFTTINLIGANVTAVDAGGGVVDVTITGGGGGGGGSFTIINVAGDDPIDGSVTGGEITLIAGANVTITSNPLTGEITISSSYIDTNTTYTAGAGVNLSGTKFIVDPNTASHVGLVDPSTGNDSSSDDAQVGVLWHAVSGYNSSGNFLYGTANGDATKPVARLKKVDAWLKTLPSWDATKPMLLIGDGGNDGNEVQWMELKLVLKLLTGWDAGDPQSIGHDAAGDPAWQDDATACP